jgi:hypothetical protein
MPDATGMLTKEDYDKLAAWFAKFNRPFPNCPVCGSDKWTYGAHLLQPLTLGGGGQIQFGGIGYPQVTIVSTPCGYTIFINAVIAGLLPPAPPSAPPPPPAA